MEGASGVIMMIIFIDILTIVFIVKDDRYFFDEEKTKLIFVVLVLPIVGAVYIGTKLRDDIKWYVGMAVVTLALICSTRLNRWDLYYCMKILSRLGKLLS